MNIYKWATVFEKLANSNARILGEDARKINNYLDGLHGVDALQKALEVFNYKLGPKADSSTYFILDSIGNIVINGFAEMQGRDFEFKIRPKNMLGLIKDYQVKEDPKARHDFMNSMEAYKRWEDDGLD